MGVGSGLARQRMGVAVNPLGPPSPATMRGVQPSNPRCSALAPAASSRRTDPAWPMATACVSGVCPYPLRASIASGEASLRSSARRASAPIAAARCSAEPPDWTEGTTVNVIRKRALSTTPCWPAR